MGLTSLFQRKKKSKWQLAKERFYKTSVGHLVRPKSRFARASVLAALAVAVTAGVAVTRSSADEASAASVCMTLVGSNHLPGQFICGFKITKVVYGGKLHVFVVGKNYHVYHSVETNAAKGTMGKWEDLKGSSRSQVITGTYLGMLQIKIMGPDSQWHYNFFSPKYGWSGWSKTQVVPVVRVLPAN